MRDRSLDVMKALLLWIVIFGHCIGDRVSDSGLKQVIYTFHMPAFLFLAGSLVSSRIMGLGVGPLLSYYFKRMLGAWLAVSFVWQFVYHGVPRNQIGILADLILKPKFHLWFVPVFVVSVLLLVLGDRLRLNGGGLSEVLVLPSMLFLLGFGLSLMSGLDKLAFDRRFLSSPVWVAYGLAYSHGKVRLLPRWMALTLVAAGYGGLILDGWKVDFDFNFLTVIVSVGVCNLLPRFASWLRERNWNCTRVLGRAGQRSLVLYLLHPFVTAQFNRAAFGWEPSSVLWSILLATTLVGLAGVKLRPVR